ncbi:MAG: type II secretion system protein GspG [Candidatus Omnitrophica bacterium]|nr:type II secretion system protein GspG [Candidatus Omnitrophota bacterium]MBU2045059.1 type II secretion system protein GspG [Candidatus Omnitrophota bacterium]MBU2251461.1 type II secretion system protein GspG [Candidatus Omnitrophota bacterium]
MKKAFTLIELIVVIAIIAILAAVIAPNAFRAIEKAKVAKAVSDMKTLKSGLLAFFTDTGTFTGAHYFKSRGCVILEAPSCDVCLSLNNSPLIDNQAAVAGWDGPYTDKVLDSPFDHDFEGEYTFPGTYFIGGSGACYTQGFDLDGDSNIDIFSAIAIHLAGLTKKQAYAVNKVFDSGEEEVDLNAGDNDKRGVVNIRFSNSGQYYYIFYYVGTGGHKTGICN